MATHAYASAIVPASVDAVWSALREFTFPAKLISTVASVEMEDGAAPTQVGAVRKVVWKNGATIRHRLLEVSDARRTLVWEVLPGEEAVSVVSAAETKVQLYRVTENNSTFISWSTGPNCSLTFVFLTTLDFSSDVAGQHVVEAQQDYAENLKEIKAFFSK